MTILALPAIPGVESVDWDIERNVAVQQSPLGHTLQRQVRGGDRWRCTLNFPLYQHDDAGVLEAFLREATRGDRWLYLSPPQNSLRGNWAPAELVDNGRFVTDASGWTPTSATLSVNARRLRILNTSAATGYANDPVAVETGKPHVLLAERRRGKAAAWKAELRNGTAAEVTATDTTEGRTIALWTPSVSSSHVRLFCNTAVAGDYVYWSNVSLSRCLQVNGASQTGNRLNVDGGPASVSAAIRAGSYVGVLAGTQYQLLQLTEDLDTDSTGAGTLVFEPGLRASPADNAPVIVRAPFARFIIPSHSAPAAVSSPNLHGFSISLIEDISA